MTNLEELRALPEGSPLPWEVRAHPVRDPLSGNNLGRWYEIVDAKGRQVLRAGVWHLSEANARRVVAAVNALPALLAEVETLRADRNLEKQMRKDAADRATSLEAQVETLRKERDAARERLESIERLSLDGKGVHPKGRVTVLDAIHEHAMEALAALTPPKPEATEAAKGAAQGAAERAQEIITTHRMGEYHANALHVEAARYVLTGSVNPPAKGDAP
jgi:FtsZ-binding cell division protein ZapB